MGEMAEDRIYADHTESATAYVAARIGLVTVSVADNRIGRFQIDRRGETSDVAAGEGILVVGTPEDVLVGDLTAGTDDRGRDDPDQSEGAHEEGVETYAETGFGPAVAVGVDAGDPVAATADGQIGRRIDGEWFEIAAVDGEVRAIDGGLVAASDGVYRANPDGLDYVGLDDARDVAAAGPYAATADGLYELGNGWIRAVEGRFDAVAADNSPAHAAGDRIWARRDGEWHPADVAVPEPVAGIAHAGGTYAVTVGGTAIAHAGDGLPGAGDRKRSGEADGTDRVTEGWRTRSLGVQAVGGVAIPTPRI